MFLLSGPQRTQIGCCETSSGSGRAASSGNTDPGGQKWADKDGLWGRDIVLACGPGGIVREAFGVQSAEQLGCSRDREEIVGLGR